MIGKILAGKLVTSIAYTLMGAEVVKSNVTMENARKLAGGIGKVATTTGRAVHRGASSLAGAVSRRKAEILSDEDVPY